MITIDPIKRPSKESSSADKTEIPNNLSKFHNDAGFITGEDVKYIRKVTALPDNPDPNTFYIITA